MSYQTPQREVELMAEYIRLHHGRNAEFADLPEKTMGRLFNQLSPEARAIVKQNQAFVQNFRDSGGRELHSAHERELNLPAVTGPLCSRSNFTTGQEG